MKVKTMLMTLLILLMMVLSGRGIEAGEVLRSDRSPGKTIRVPQDKPSIQAAIEAAEAGDTVLVSPGTYHEAIILDKGPITLASRFLETNDPQDIQHTILDGNRARGGKKLKKADFVINITKRAGPNVRIIGFTIRNGDDGIRCAGDAQILHNRFLSNNDAIDYEDGKGLCQFNEFENNGDDAVDLDGATEVIITDNQIRNSGDDGIEIRLHPYSGPTLNIVIRRNFIVGNGEDGIQIIDYPDRSDRIIWIERNVIANNAMAAIGCMGDGNTRENYEAADIPERIELFHNTIVGNTYGVTGGDNLLALNNIFVNVKRSALKGVDGSSLVTYTLFWKNGTDFEQSNVDEAHILRADPLLDERFRPRAGSPCIDAGSTKWQSAVAFHPDPKITGSAPDLGAFEFGSR